MKKKRYPTVFIVAFCASCVVLAILAGSIANHDVALSAIAVVGWIFIIRLLAVQVRAGWMRQKEVPRTLTASAARLLAAIATTATAVCLAAIVGPESWWKLLTGLVSVLGIMVVADCAGALCQMVKQKPGGK